MMLIHTKLLLPALQLNSDELKFAWPDFYLWFDANRKRVGMHESKFKRELLKLFNSKAFRVDLNKYQITRK